MNPEDILIKSLEVTYLHFKFVGVTGIRDIKSFDINILLEKVTAIGNEKNVTVQVFDSELIATWEHLLFSAHHAVKAFLNSCNISKSLAIESLIYASGQRQITLAVNLLGLKPKTRNCALLLIGTSPEEIKSVAEAVYEELGGILDMNVLDIDISKFYKIKKTFGISDLELDALISKNMWMERKTALLKLILEQLAFLHL
jgi:tRNA threonylcarbamoyladenosine modification (KEOPS) complex Cgi121 subunit